MRIKLPKAIKRLAPVPDDLLVKSPNRWRRVLATMAAIWVFGIGALVVGMSPATRDSSFGWFAGPILGGLIAHASVSTSRRVQAYRRGWIHGRGQMVHALVEAGRRGLTLDDWLRAQMEQDSVIVGEPLPPREDEDA